MFCRCGEADREVRANRVVGHAGAQRGLLMLVRDGEPRIEAAATTGQGRIEVAVRPTVVTPSDLLRLAHRYTLSNGRRYAFLDRGLTDEADAKSLD